MVGVVVAVAVGVVVAVAVGVGVGAGVVVGVGVVVGAGAAVGVGVVVAVAVGVGAGVVVAVGVGVVVGAVVAVAVGVVVGVVVEVGVAVVVVMKNTQKPSAADFLSGVGKTPTEPSEAVTEAYSGPSVDFGWDTNTTPSGIEVRFQNEPKRKYELRGGREGFIRKEEDWLTVPSVTQVLDVLEKGGLSHWGMRVGVEGVIELVKECWLSYDWSDLPTSEQIIDLLKTHKLTVNSVRNKAGDRGNSLHQAFQYWAETDTIPDPEFYSQAEQGYVTGLIRFLKDAKPKPIQSENMVGSVQYGFAGRYDLLAFYGGHEIYTHTTPSGRNSKRETLEPGVFLFDLKTSKSCYATHALQLAAYEWANNECGYEKPDQKAVVRVTDDGRYEVKTSLATIEDFLSVKNTYDTMQKELFT